MLNYMEYLNLPTTVCFVLVATFFILQVVGELLEFKGKVVPEFLKIRKYFARKKREREILAQMPEMMNEVKALFDDFGSHYKADNIMKRDKWIDSVNDNLKRNDEWLKELDKKLDRNNEDILSLIIDSKRNSIIHFASKVIDENFAVTREQFNRVFKLYEEYEGIIEKNGLTNGEVDIAYRIIQESYEHHLKHHTFVEDIRGYDI